MSKRLKSSMGIGTAPPEKARESNIELFRIVAMMFIVAHHFVVNSGLMAVDGPIYTDPLSWHSLFLLEIGAWGKIGINCFVMITCYFMCTSKITARKFAKLLLEVMFYKIVINAIFWITGYADFSLTGFLKVIIPIRTVYNDFLNAFLLFYLLIPFLNILVHHINERQHILLMLWCGFTYIFLGTIPGFSVLMNYVSWFAVLFVIVSYIRLYPKKIYQDRKVWAWLTLICVVLSAVSVFVCAWLGMKTGRTMAYGFVTDSNTFLAVGVGVCAFMLFKNLEMGYSKTINAIAAATFGVVLIHANSDTMRRWLWIDTLDVVGHYSSALMPLYAIGSVLAVFTICVIIDRLRIRFLEKPFFRLWDKHWDSVLMKYREIETRVFSKIGVQE